jgi:hypothetical protein
MVKKTATLGIIDSNYTNQIVILKRIKSPYQQKLTPSSANKTLFFKSMINIEKSLQFARTIYTLIENKIDNERYEHESIKIYF